MKKKQNVYLLEVVNLGAVLILLFGPYSFFNIPGPEFVAVIIGVISVAATGKMYIPPAYRKFFLYMITVPAILTIVSGIRGNLLSTLIPTTLIIFTFCISTIPYALSRKRFLKYYKRVIIISIYLTIYQFFMTLINGSYTAPYLPFLSCIYDFPVSDLMSNHDRPSAFFAETSHFIGFLIPYICYEYSKCLEHKRITLMMMALLVTLVMAKSGTGFLTLAILAVYGLWFLNVSKLKKIIIISSGVMASLLFLSWFQASELGSYIFRRVIELNGEEGQYQSSGFIRIFRGYQIYALRPLVNQIFGSGVGELDNIINSNHILFQLFRNERINLMNGIQMMLYTGGVVGTFLFFRYLLSFIKGGSFTTKTIIFTLIVYMMVEATYLNPRMLLFLLTAGVCMPLRVTEKYTKKKKVLSTDSWGALTTIGSR